MTEFDRRRLENLLEVMRARTALDHPRLAALEEELARARILRAADVPSDVITMNSTTEVLDVDADKVLTLTLVFPRAPVEARNRAHERNEAEAEHISVLSPVGMALLGSREEDEIVVSSAGRQRRLRVLRVLYQPEATGNFAL